MAERLLIADNTGDELFELDPDGVDSEGTPLRDLPSGLTTPLSMAVYNGRLLIADNTGDELFELDPDGADTQGTRLRSLPSGLTAPQGMAVYNGRLLIADNTGDELFELDPDGADTQGTLLRDMPSGLEAPQGMAVYNGRLLIADSTDDELFELDPDGADTQGTRLRSLPSGLTAPVSMAVYNGRLLIADNFGGELFELDPDGADTQGTLLRDMPSGLGEPRSMAVLVTLPDAEAPTVEITSAAEVDERTTLGLTAAVSDGEYDSIAYAWDDGSAGGSFSAQAATTVYTPPDVSSVTAATITCEVTAEGDGTDAADGTEDTASATKAVSIRPEVANEQVFTLPASTHEESSLTHRWTFEDGERPALADIFKTNDSDVRLLAGIVIGNNNYVELLFAASQTEAASTRNDLADIFETNGAFELVADNRTLTLDLDSQDLTEPYRWQPDPTTPVSSFRTGVGSGDGVEGVLTLDSGVRPDAVAPTVTIAAVSEVDEDDTLALSASVSGGTYDGSLAYAWEVDSGGGTITGTGSSVTYNPPDIASDTPATVSCTVTATGDGTNAADGTTDTDTDTEDFTVRVVLPDATAPTTFAIDAVDGVDEDETLSLTVSHSGGVYDTLDLIWQILFSGGGSISGTGATVTYNPADVSADTEITVAVTGTARGTGTLAKSGTSQSTNDQEVFTVRQVILLALDDAQVPDGRRIVGEASLITVPSDGDVYDSDATVEDGADPPNLGDDSLTATRIYVTGNDQLRMSNSGIGDIQTLYTSGALSDYQIHVQTSFDASSRVSFDNSDIDQGRSRPARLIVGTTQDPDGILDDVAALADGDRVLWFLTEPLPTAAGSATAGTPTATAEASTETSASGSAAAGEPTASATASTETSAAGAATAGTPTATGRASTTAPAASGSATAGTPTATAEASTVPSGVSGTATAGSPTATGEASTVPSGVEGSAIAGSPTARATATTPLATPSGRARAGTPTASGEASTVASGAAGTATAGSPTATARATTPSASASGSARAGAPTAAATASTATSASGSARAGSATATAAAASVTLADALIPDGRQLVGMASLIQVPSDGDVFDSDATVLAGANPPNLGDASLNATRIYVTPNPQLRVSEDGAGNIEAIFSAGGSQDDYQIHVQTSTTDVLTYDSDDIDAGRSTGARILLGTNNDPDGLLSDVEALVGGNRIIWFLTEPVPAVRGSARAGTPTASAGASTETSASGSASAGTPTATATASTAAVASAAGSARAGTPTATASASTTAATAAGTATAGSPTASAEASTTPSGAVGSARAGTPTATARALPSGTEATIIVIASDGSLTSMHTLDVIVTP